MDIQEQGDMKENCEWISVSELARRIGKSKQTAYNLIEKGVYETKTFSRGKMNGYLVKFNVTQQSHE